MKLNKWIKSPKGYITSVLLGYLALASLGSGDISGLKNAGIAVLTATVTDILYRFVKKLKWTMPDSAIITGLIISLILSTPSSAIVVAGTVFIAIFSKHLLVYRKKPIFNPAVVGLLVSIPIFHTQQSWWGAFGDLPAWTVIFLLIGGYLITNRVSKFSQVFAFLGTSFVLLIALQLLHIGDVTDAYFTPFINATLFFGFFMLTDPPTTPGKDKDQVVFSIITGAIGTTIFAIFGGLSYLFIGMAVGNLYYLLKKRSSSKSSAHQARVAKA